MHQKRGSPSFSISVSVYGGCDNSELIIIAYNSQSPVAYSTHASRVADEQTAQIVSKDLFVFVDVGRWKHIDMSLSRR